MSDHVVYCEAIGAEHRGMHVEAYDCRWPHEVAPGGPVPLVQDEAGDLTGEW